MKKSKKKSLAMQSRTRPDQEVYEEGASVVPGVVRLRDTDASKRESEVESANLNLEASRRRFQQTEPPMNPEAVNSRYQRFLRLQQEAHALLNESSEEKANGDDVLSATTLRDLKTLSDQLQRAVGSSEGRWGVGGLVSNTSTNDFQATLSDAVATPGAVTYELWADKTSESRLLRRVADLEHHLGVKIGKNDSLSLREELSEIEEGLKILESESVESIESRISALHEKLTSITTDANVSSQVARVSAAINRWDQISSSLPLVIRRLSLLRELHESAAKFDSRLSLVESEQKNLCEMLREGSEALSQVSEGMGHNATNLDRSISSLNARLDALKE